jgi:HSP20 family molecular chaperone IbpA
MAKTIEQHLQETVAYLTPPSQSVWTPNTDVYETPEHLIVKLELAGIEKTDLQVIVEIDYGPFERRILIPRVVDAQRTQARFENGFLRIELPKSKQFHPVVTSVVIQETL